MNDGDGTGGWTTGDRRCGRQLGFRQDWRGASEVIGLSLILIISMVTTGIVLANGSGVFTDSKDQIDVKRNEQALAAFDNRASIVALGEAPDRRFDLGNAGDGIYRVDENAGWLRVVHKNYSGTSTETIYNGTLGAVIYENGDTEIGYQGGGVFRLQDGHSVMVSPPEFHYRDDTLTLPITRVTGSGQAAGHVSATVSQDGERPNRIYPDPNTSAPLGEGSPYDDTNAAYGNPILNGGVVITVHSEYYEGWAQFFETRTEAIVSVDHATRTVSVELTTLGHHGRFDMPAEGNPIAIKGFAPHGAENFTISLRPDDGDNARFNNLQWSMQATAGNKEMEIHLRLNGPNNDPTTNCKEQDISATVYYSDDNGNTYHGWHDPTAFRTECFERGDDDLHDEVRLEANLTSTATMLTMGDVDSDDLEYFNPSGGTAKSSVTFGHGAVDDPGSFTTGDSASVGLLVNHYLSLMGPQIDLIIEDKNSNTINEAASWGNLAFDGQGQISYLYISENKIEVEF